MSVTKALNTVLFKSLQDLGKGMSEKFELDPQEVSEFISEWCSGKVAKAGTSRKREMTGYNLFCKEKSVPVRETLSTELEEWESLDNKEKLSKVSKKIGEMWVSLPQEKKDQYTTNAKATSNASQPKKSVEKKAPRREISETVFVKEWSCWCIRNTKIVVSGEGSREIQGRYLTKKGMVAPLTKSQVKKYTDQGYTIRDTNPTTSKSTVPKAVPKKKRCVVEECGECLDEASLSCEMCSDGYCRKCKSCMYKCEECGRVMCEYCNCECEEL